MPRMLFLATFLLATVAGCQAGGDRTTAGRMPTDRVDSILPMETLMARFRDSLPRVDSFTGGSPDRETLVRRFLAAVTARDSQAIRDMVVSRAEFGWLVFPDHIYHLKPYELDPAIFWLQLSAPSSQGIKELLGRYGGVPLVLDSLGCPRDTTQLFRGTMAMWGPCTARVRTPDTTLTHQFFGSIIARDGRYKFLSYRNDL